MTQPDKIEDARLHAYIDGALDQEARAEVETWLAAHPEDAARVRAYQSQRAALHARYDAVLEESLPPGLYAALELPVAGRRPRSWMRVAAALVLVIVGAAGGWLARDLTAITPVNTRGFVDRAMGAHAVYVGEVRHPVEVGADQEAHLVAWLSKRLERPIRAPDMAAAGFALVGGRLLPDGGRPAAQFMYEDATGRRITLYVRAAGGARTAFRFAAGDGASAFYWIEGSLSYALIGDVPREVLLGLARIAYDAL